MFILQVAFYSLKFVGIVFVSSLYDPITLSHVIAKSSLLISISQLHIEGSQI